MSRTGSAGNKVSVLVSVDSAAEGLLQIHHEVSNQLDHLGLQYEIIYLVGTGDSAVLDQVRSLHSREPARVRVLQFGQRVGEALMLSAGVERATGDILLTVPAHFESDLGVLASLYEAILEGADVASAARTRGPWRVRLRLQSRIFNKLISWASGSRFQDIASGTRAIRRQVVEEVPLYGDLHRYLPLLAERVGFSIREIPSSPHPRATGSFDYTPLTYLWRALDVLSVFFLSRFTRYPLRLFGGLGSAFAATGAVVLLVVGIQRLLGAPLADRPVLVLGTLLVGLGVQAFAIGLLGELILFFHARSVRDYRISAVYEPDPAPLAAEPLDTEAGPGHPES